jgi:hypothetical protein
MGKRDHSPLTIESKKAQISTVWGAMIEFLKRFTGAAGLYSKGKAYETWYDVAESATLLYIIKLGGPDADSDSKRFAACVWSYLLSTAPRNAEMAEFQQGHEAQVENEALKLLDVDLPLREVIVSTLYVALAVCRGYDDEGRFERIMDSHVFAKYSGEYPVPSHSNYANLVEGWATVYSPPPGKEYKIR